MDEYFLKFHSFGSVTTGFPISHILSYKQHSHYFSKEKKGKP